MKTIEHIEKGEQLSRQLTSGQLGQQQIRPGKSDEPRSTPAQGSDPGHSTIEDRERLRKPLPGAGPGLSLKPGMIRK
jgi:hypothetical protein